MASITPTLDDELGVPKEATLKPTTITVSLETNNNSGVSIPLSAETCNRPNGRSWVVGRQAATADIRIQHKSISRKHAVLYILDNMIFLKDFGGKHGTTVDDQKVEAGSVLELKHGATILFGNVRENVFRVRVKVRPSLDQCEDAENKEVVSQLKEPDNNDHSLIDKAGEGLTGRAKRQAEIAAMMNSLDQAPSYTKQAAPAAAPVDEPAALEKQPAEMDAARQAIERFFLPVSKQFTIPSESERKNVTCVAIDPTGSRFVVGSTDTRLRFYNFGGMDRNRTDSFKVLIPDDGHLLVDCAFSNTGDRVLVGTGGVQPKVLDREGGEIIKFMRGDMYVTDQAKTVGHTAAVTSVDWHPLERDIVLTASNDGSARLWNLNGKTQFHMLVCDKVFQAKSERGQRTVIKSVCFHPGGREFALSTVCGSIQVWNRARVSGRPERAVFGAHGEKKPITSLTYNVDGSKLASRSEDDDTVRVWNAQRLSSSSVPLVVCTRLETIHERANSCFSPNGKILCAGSSTCKKEHDRRVESGCLNFYDLTGVSEAEVVTDPIHSLDLDGHVTPVITKWHSALNQIFVGCSDGRMLIFYDPVRSTKGALLPATKAGRGVDGLADLLRSRAPQGSAAIAGEIVTPFSLPMYRDNTISENKRKRHERKDPVISKEPERPATGKHKAGGQAGANLSFAQLVADQRDVKKKTIAGKDPREALFQYNKKVNDGNESKLAEKTAEEEEEELQSKKNS